MLLDGVTSPRQALTSVTDAGDGAHLVSAWARGSHLQPFVRPRSLRLQGSQGRAGSPKFPVVATSSLASLGTAPLVVWGRLVCLYLKFPDSEFDVRAGLLVEGLAGRLSPHECTWLSASPGKHGRRTELGRGPLVAERPAWGLRSLALLLALLAWQSCFLGPLLAKNSPSGSP